MNRSRTSLLLSFAIVSMAFASVVPTAAATATLDVCATGCAYTDVPSALAAAASGDTVLVRPGTYTAAISINAPVTLCGGTAASAGCVDNAANVILDGAGSIYPVWIGANDVTVRGVTVQNPTFTAVGFVDPSLIVVDGDRATISNTILQNVGSIPLPGESRWYTIAINVASGEDLTITDNAMRDFPPSKGAGATCANAPCSVVGILNWGGTGDVVINGNDIRILGAGQPAAAIQLKDQNGAQITDNVLRVPGADPSGPRVAGIQISNSISHVLVQGNDIATGLAETPYGSYGVFGVFSNSDFVGNEFRATQHGIMLRSSATGGNEIRDNLFFDNNQGVLNYAHGTLIEGNTFDLGITAVLLDSVGPGYSSSEDVILRHNTFDNHTTNLGITDTVTGQYVDARENDWGAYSSDLIALRMNDASGTNDIDFSCFIDSDGTTLVCPVASFTTSITGASWPRTVTLTDTSTTPGSSLGSRAWTLPGGATSSAAVVTLSLGPGAYTVDLEITDEEGFIDTATDSFTLTNAAPTLTLPASYAGVENAPFSLSVPATDADGDTLTYTLVSGPAGMTLQSATGALSWTPGYASAGTHAFSVSVTDGSGTATASSSVIVSDVPVGPTVAPIAPVNLKELHSATRSVTATSPSGSPITLSATGLPPGATFVDNGDGTGVVAYTAPAGSQGVYAATISATSEGITATRTLTITVIQNVAFSLERLTPGTHQASPGETILISAKLKNLGSGSDHFVPVTTSTKGWPMAVPTSQTLATGQETTVTIAVTIPQGGDVQFVTLRVCSAADATICKELRTRVEVPVIVTLSIADNYSPLSPITGTIRAKYLDGNPVAGAGAIFATRSDLGLPMMDSEIEGTTDANGVFAFSQNGFQARIPGDHSAFATVRHGAITSFVSDSYTVGP